MMHPLFMLALPAALCAQDPQVGIPVPEAGPVTSATALPSPSDSLAALYQRAQEWELFFEGVDARRELWIQNWTGARIPETLAARAREAGPWRILVITEAGCSDSVSSVPYIAKLVEETPGLDLRVANSTEGRPWMEAHRSPDGRASTPTVLVLDEEYRIRGCWIEQPVGLQGFWLPVVARGTMSEEVGEKFAWYAEDEGRETLRELVEVLEGARMDRVICPGLDGRS